MAKVWKRKDRDVWVVDYRNGGGRRVRLTAKTRQDAEDLLSQKIKEARQAIPNAPTREFTLTEYAIRWLESMRHELEPKTWRSYWQLLQLHILPALGRVKLRELRRGAAKELLNQKRQQGYSKNTVRLIRATLSTVLSEAVDDQIIPANPVLGRSKHRRSYAPQPEVRPMTREQLGLFEHAIVTQEGDAQLDSRYGTLFLVMLKTGLRPGEGFALQTGDLYLRRRRLRIERALTLGRALKATKDAEAREVDLSPALLRRLESYSTWLEAEGLVRGWAEPRWLFPNEVGQAIDESKVRKVFQRILRLAGLPNFRLYDLRHTYASLLLSLGTPLVYVSEQLGHSKATTTLRYYAHWIPCGDRQYVAELDSVCEETWHQNLAPRSHNVEGVSEALENYGGSAWARPTDRLMTNQLAFVDQPFQRLARSAADATLRCSRTSFMVRDLAA